MCAQGKRLKAGSSNENACHWPTKKLIIGRFLVNGFVNHSTCILSAAALLLLVEVPVCGEALTELNAKFEKSKSELAKQHVGELINYLKKNPQANDFGDALEALAQLDVPEEEGPILHKLMQKRSVFLRAQLDAPKDPDKTLGQIDELVKINTGLGNEDANLRLLERKYDLVVDLPEGENRFARAVGDKGVIPALISEYHAKRMKADALVFLNRVKKDFPTIKADALAKIEEVFASMDSIGEPFTLNFRGTDGQEINLANYRGKVVLIDFWATWCGPCVRAVPLLLDLYEKFHDQGFEVLGISLDQDRDALQQFCSDRKIPWPQFFDGKGWKNELAVAHAISAIPTTYLIDRDNKLVAVGLHGDELETKVVEVLQRK